MLSGGASGRVAEPLLSIWHIIVAMVEMFKTPQLPGSSGLDVGSLAASFQDTTTSYKFLWFSSILDAMKTADAILSTDEVITLPLDELAANMIKTARPLIEKYRLRFGKDDRMALLLQTNTEEDLPREIRRRIARFVPYRLLAPFFGNELNRLSPEEKNRRIKELCELRFNSDNPVPYKIIGRGRNIEAIQINPAWRKYFSENIAVVDSWVNWHWALFLETRNPSRPNIAKQILPGHNRESMTKQRNFWQQIMKKSPSPIKCLYSGKDLKADHFALDHYIPFDFIVHNQLWNLLPVDPSANSSKSNSLPHENYFDDFVEIQYNALIICQRKIIRKDLVNLAIAEYSEALNLDIEKELNITKVQESYQLLIPPLMTIARSYGFSNSWEYEE